MKLVGRMRFNRRVRAIFLSLSFGGSVVALGIELSATRLSAGYGQPALDYHQSRAPRSRTETLLFPKQACFHLHLYPKFLKYPRPPSAVPGNRTPVCGLKARDPEPLDERGMLCCQRVL